MRVGKPKGKGGRKRKAGDDGEGKSGKGKGGKKAKTAPVEQDGEREDGEEGECRSPN